MYRYWIIILLTIRRVVRGPRDRTSSTSEPYKKRPRIHFSFFSLPPKQTKPLFADKKTPKRKPFSHLRRRFQTVEGSSPCIYYREIGSEIQSKHHEIMCFQNLRLQISTLKPWISFSLLAVVYNLLTTRSTDLIEVREFTVLSILSPQKTLSPFLLIKRPQTEKHFITIGEELKQ